MFVDVMQLNPNLMRSQKESNNPPAQVGDAFHDVTIPVTGCFMTSRTILTMCAPSQS